MASTLLIVCLGLMILAASAQDVGYSGQTDGVVDTQGDPALEYPLGYGRRFWRGGRFFRPNPIWRPYPYVRPIATPYYY